MTKTFLPLFARLLSLAVFVLLPACQKVDDMHDATMQMNATTSALANTTQDTKSLMGEIYDSGRQGAALHLRDDLYKLTEESTKLEEKATNAGLYFEAFEFQLWTDLGVDSLPGERDRLMRDAADEFFCHLLSITHWDDVDPFAGKNPLAFGKTENERATFNAFAMTLEKNNRRQEYGLANRVPVSMLTMTQNALLADQEIKAGRARISDFPPYVDIIRSHPKEAVLLLKARHQMLGLAVLTQFIPIAHNYFEGFKYKIWGQRWTLDLARLNDSELRLADYRLAHALRARDFLAKLGVAETLNSDIRSIFLNAQVAHAPGARDPKSAGPEDPALQTSRDFLEHLRAYAGDGEPI